MPAPSGMSAATVSGPELATSVVPLYWGLAPVTARPLTISFLQGMWQRPDRQAFNLISQRTGIGTQEWRTPNEAQGQQHDPPTWRPAMRSSRFASVRSCPKGLPPLATRWAVIRELELRASHMQKMPICPLSCLRVPKGRAPAGGGAHQNLDLHSLGKSAPGEPPSR